MGKIYRKIFLPLLIFGYITLTAQERGAVFNAYVPEYVAENSETEILCTVYFESENIDSAEIRIYAGVVTLKDTALVKTDTASFSLPLKKEINRSVLVFPDSIIKKIVNGTSLIRFAIAEAKQTEINFELFLYEKGKQVYFLSSTEVNEKGEYLTPAILKPFASLLDRKNVLRLMPDSKFELRFPVNLQTKTVIDFWLKSEKTGGAACSLIEPDSKDTILSVISDEYGIIKFSRTDFGEMEKEKFFLKNAWSEIKIELNNSAAMLSVNDEKIAEKQIFLFNADSLILTFANFLTNGNYYLKNIIVESETESENYAQTVDLAFQQFASLDSVKYNIEYSNCDLIKSDFPVLTTPPQINISISSAYTTIEWYNDKDENISEYILEKSLGFGAFEEIFSVENAEKGRRYYFDDYNSENNSIIFYRVKQIDKNGEIIYSHQVKVGKAKINDFVLKQNYPNPFNPSTSFAIEVIIPGYFEIGVYDLVGKEIQVLHRGTLTQGTYRFDFDAQNLPSGIYLLRVKSSNQTIVKKMIYTK